MRLCLVYPAARHMIRTNVPSVVDDVTGFYPPLGLLYVAGAVAARGRDAVEVIDAVAEGLDEQALEARIRASRPDVVGVQAITFTLLDAYATARVAKRVNPRLPVVMGGPHANLYPRETLGLPEVDYVLLGEGEANINPFLDMLRGEVDPHDVRGLVRRGGDGEPVFGAAHALIDDLDSLPMPARHLVPTSRYASVLGTGKPLTTIMSSRGCPARCIFCDRPHLGKRFRARSARSVADEIEACRREFGIEEFFFYDDTFTIDRRRVFDVCREVEARGLNVAWDIRARVSTVDREVLAALSRAGCKRIHFGIESGSPRVLETMRKGVDLEYARQVFGWCREVGIETLAYFMLGFPSEGRNEIAQTTAYALSIPCDYVHVAVTTPFPGTELYRMGLANGLFKEDFWAAFARAPSEDFVPRVWDETLSRDELIGAMNHLYNRFYRRPGYLARRLLRIRSLRELRTKASAGVRLLCRTGRNMLAN